MSVEKKLLIVESPAKSKTIGKFLGKDFVVKASMGHVRDIPHKAVNTKFGIDLEHNYQPVYEPLPTRVKVLRELKDAAKKADKIYLAPDPDREGEAIAWHLQEELKLPADRTYRVTFNSITKNAVREAMQQPSKINMDLVNAQQGRRVLDRLVGFSLTPFLLRKIAKGLSGGRVQSVAVRLLVDREREIVAFKPEEFWKVDAELSAASAPETKFWARLTKWENQKFELGNPAACTSASVEAIVAALQKANYQITAIDKKTNKNRSGAPFITSSLQQAASTALYFGAKKTMMLAQRLYEGLEVAGALTGLITYMRTDSTRVAPEALGEARKYIGENYSAEYLPEKPNFFASKKDAQDAHEAIRPTNVFITPDILAQSLKNADRDLVRLYDLIWRRFVASQMEVTVSETTTVTISAGAGVFEAKGRVIIFDGYKILEKERLAKIAKNTQADTPDAKKNDEPKESDNDEQSLPLLGVNEKLQKEKLQFSQHFTQPPPRYSEASLVKKLEEEGIGRPSTYATIIQTIQDRGYAVSQQRRFTATRLGMMVTDVLLESFPDIMDLHFTAEMEKNLDDVEDGKRDWHKIIDEFYRPFSQKIEKVVKTAEPAKREPAPNGEKCPRCGGEMQVRYTKTGAFLGCKKYPECKGTINFVDEKSDLENLEPQEEINCPRCGSPMQKKSGRFGAFVACSNSDCKQILSIGKTGVVNKVPADINWDAYKNCARCGKPMLIKPGKCAFTVVCSGKPECSNRILLDLKGNLINVPEIAEEDKKCEKCGAEMVVRLARRGPFLSCSKFPKCRNAKSLPGVTPPVKRGSKKTGSKRGKITTE